MLDDPLENGPYAPASEPLEPGPYSRTEGFWGYNEICEKQTTETGWTVVRNEYYKAPYTFKDRYWIGYDDYDSLTEKVSYQFNIYITSFHRLVFNYLLLKMNRDRDGIYLNQRPSMASFLF